ncbi:MAG: DUF853 domain-containing protein [Bacteroidaceae bacterium]|nr:DUF853 domain-containing protein [Bacteroidaceae bacterium]
MFVNGNLYIARGADGPICLTGRMCNRHGLIAGGSSRSTSATKKTTSTRKTSQKSNSSTGSILGSAATTATRRVTNEILKNIFK